METENKKSTGENNQITFKLSPEERRQIEADAMKIGISVSEYCRIKCSLNENAMFEAKRKVGQLEKLVNELSVKLSYYKETERDPNSIVMQLTPPQREILEGLFTDFEEGWDGLSIGENILAALIRFALLESIYGAYFYDKEITREEVEEAFYEEKGHFKFR